MRTRLVGYGLSAAAVAAAVALRWLLDPVLGDSLPLVTLYGAVAAAVWLAGPGAAVLTAAVGYAACSVLFIAPRGEIDLGSTRDLVGLLTYLFTCSILVALGQAMRVAQRRAEERSETLRMTLTSIGDGLITTDGAGCVSSLNPIAESLTGWTQAEAAGRPLVDVFRIVNEQTRQPVENPALRAIRERRVIALANHTLLLGKDGGARPIDDCAAPVLGRDGAVLGCVLVFRDVSTRRAFERRLDGELEARRVLSAIVESSSDAIVSKSLDGIVQTWNAGAERLFGYPAAEAVGRHISFIIPPDRLEEETLILSRLRAGERIENFDTMRQRRDGRLVHIALTVSPVRDEEGRIVGASKVARDVTERKAAEERIHALLADLKESDRRKDEFLATLAHELRGPLAPLQHALGLLKLAEGDPELIQQAHGVMDRQLRQLERLVDDLIDVSRFTRNQIELRRERVDLTSVLEQAVEACRPISECARQLIQLTASPVPLVLDADRARLTQVFANLVHNACKYSEPGGHIELRSERDGDHAVVTVKDVGIGIAPDQIHKIFEIFTQVDQRLERAQGGLGIGLSLVKRFVEMHGGSVTAHSDGLDRGSEFVVRLPISSAAAECEPGASSASGSVYPRRILVVDDNADAASSLALLLSIGGHDTRIAHDGLEAVEVAEKFRPDIALLDLGLPLLNGYDVARRIREQPWGRGMVLVALSGWGQPEDRRRALEAGFDDHMVKPMDHAALTRLIAEAPKRAFS